MLRMATNSPLHVHERRQLCTSSTAEVVTIPRKEGGIDIAKAVAEAQRAGIGPLGSSSGANGSAARVKGSLWGTDQGLLSYSDLMMAVPDELSSAATALHCMVRELEGRIVMLSNGYERIMCLGTLRQTGM